MRIAEDFVCTGCGTCVGICPEGIIEIRRSPGGLYSPKVKHSKCGECGLCRMVCPSDSVKTIDFGRSIFGVNHEFDPLLGHFIECYYGHSIGGAWRSRSHVAPESSSGGLASELAMFALEKKLIDGVVVTTLDRPRSLEPRVYIARTPEEVLSASGSKYCPVPLGLSIKEILKQEGRFAVVGLPCHIYGIRKAESIVKGLRSKIVMHLGLFCGHSVNFLGTEFLLQRFAISKTDVSRLYYRRGGWPGRILLKMRDGRAIYLPFYVFMQVVFGSYLFAPMSCIFCSDFSNELADISLGDAWLPELMKKQRKESFIVVRSQEGRQLLQRAIADKRIWIAKVDRSRIVRCCKGNLSFKKRGLLARIRIARVLGHKVPIPWEGFAFPVEPGFISYVLGFLVYFSVVVSSTSALAKLLRYVPFPMLRLYSSIVGELKSSVKL